MNKQAIVDAILAELEDGFDTFRAVSQRTRAAGNDSESKAEGKYDTRSIEENYLADGLARQALATAEAAQAFSGLPVVEFGKASPIDIGALVQVAFPDETAWFFLGPAAGGVEVEEEGQVITVLTRESPLGSQLIGRKAGEKIPSPKVKIISVE